MYAPDLFFSFPSPLVLLFSPSLLSAESFVLRDIFGEEAVVPTSHASGYMKLNEVQGHDDDWWTPYEVRTYRAWCSGYSVSTFVSCYL